MNWIGMIIGAAAGLVLGLVLKCPGNTCPITSNWWLMMIIGAVLGFSWKA